MISGAQRNPALRVAAILLLVTSAAWFEAARVTSLAGISSSDIWWHLRVGTWILQTHGVPHSGLFSQWSDLPWRDASWAFDALLAFAFRELGLRSIPALQMGCQTALAVVTFLLAGGLRGRFWVAVALSAIAQLAIAGIPLSPGFISILLFGVELFLLLEFRRTGSVRLLFWLPVVFLLWANLDAQFVIGIASLVVFAVAAGLEGVRRRRQPPALQADPASLRMVIAAVTLAVIGTLLTPNFYRSYQVFFTGVTSSANRYLPGFPAMTFKQPQDYVLLLLAMGAYLSLGVRRSRDPFQILLLLGCTLLSFHSQRDTWLVTLAAIAIIGESARGTPPVVNPEERFDLIISGTAVVLGTIAILTASVLRLPHDRALLAKVAESYPVAASDYIRHHPLKRPLFNTYEWGGFLMWYLPEYPVAIDSRSSLYKDDYVIRYSKVMNAELPYTADPRLLQARAVLLPRDSLMGEALSSLPSFQVAYEDRVAVVLVKQPAGDSLTEASKGSEINWSIP